MRFISSCRYQKKKGERAEKREREKRVAMCEEQKKKKMRREIAWFGCPSLLLLLLKIDGQKVSHSVHPGRKYARRKRGTQRAGIRSQDGGRGKEEGGIKTGKIVLYLSKNQAERKRVQDRATKPDRLFFSRSGHATFSLELQEDRSKQWNWTFGTMADSIKKTTLKKVTVNRGERIEKRRGREGGKEIDIDIHTLVHTKVRQCHCCLCLPCHLYTFG